MTAKLTLAATPIGNLQDVSLRFIEVLSQSDMILAEDTRHTATLLHHLGIQKKMRSFHDHSNQKDLHAIQDLFLKGNHLVFVSDAGTPLVSDPGYELVQLALKLEVEIDALPGPSATLLALQLSGLPPQPFAFLGFIPQTTQKRQAWLNNVRRLKMTTIHFEAPSRILKTLGFLAKYAPETPVALCRELTKKFQQVLRGSAADILQNLDQIRGEMVLVLGKVETELPTMALYQVYQEKRQAGHSHNQSIRLLAQELSLQKREVLAKLESQLNPSKPDSELS